MPADEVRRADVPRGENGMTAIERIGRFLFRHRSLTPLPLVVLLLLFARPSVGSGLAALPFWVAGTIVRLSALRFIGGASRSRRLVPEALVTRGPFGAVRNPLYIGNLLLTTGFAIYSGEALFALVPLVLFPVQYVPVVIAEESELARRFPDAWRAYAARVPRWLPRPPGALFARGPAPFGWLEALRVERSTLRSVVALAAALAAVAYWRGGF